MDLLGSTPCFLDIFEDYFKTPSGVCRTLANGRMKQRYPDFNFKLDFNNAVNLIYGCSSFIVSIQFQKGKKRPEVRRGRGSKNRKKLVKDYYVSRSGGISRILFRRSNLPLLRPLEDWDNTSPPHTFGLTPLIKLV